MSRKWFEYNLLQEDSLNSGNPSGATFTPLSGGEVEPGDSILRTIVFASFWTKQMDSGLSDGLRPGLLTWGVGMFPTPDGEFAFNGTTLGGDALWAEAVDWENYQLGGVGGPFTYFSSRPTGYLRDSRAMRTIPFGASLDITAQLTFVGSNPTNVYCDPDIVGWIRARILFEIRH